MASAARLLTRPARHMSRRGLMAPSARYFSASPLNRVQDDPVIPPPPKELQADDYPPMPEYSVDLLTKEQRSMYDMMSPEDRAAFDQENTRMVAEFNNPQKRAAMFEEIEQAILQIDKEEDLRFEDIRPRRPGFWAEDEPDELVNTLEDGDEEINDDEITSLAHAEMELHREMREYARITAWDMPMLSKLAKPFTLPPQTHILRFRYTTYMGEQHPAEPKVVVELASQDLTPKYLTEAQRQTFLKLAGTRYNPQTDIIRISSEKFGSRAQNKRYLADVVNSMIKEAKEGDSFADIPLDLRHHKYKTRLEFPESWNMTETRRSQLAARRKERLAAEETRAALVDGNSVVSDAIKTLPSLNPALQAKATDERDRVAVKIGARKKVARR
ncbi:Ribosomal protein S24/S35, mitochondrial [Penicillium camemberti]|uniref:Ribosomal protein S24/S35, mitochondrial n=1 Tax=Penicillium camemberti (strain FM 013) TaxID=1429867 RepID=A0A0G4P412_PENC3|nr:Ribosomal protein S24/S35, mitochondrial [Penicillium camemberti]